MTDKPARVGKRAFIGTAIGLVCLWIAARQVDFDDFTAALARFDLRYLVPLIAISLGIQILRAWRWQIELSPIKQLPFGMTWKVVAIAYMMINVLPFRLGEPVRPVLMSWKSGIPIPAIVGNWVFEKMMDSASLVFFVHVTLLVADLPEWANKASVFSITLFCSLAALVVGFWLRGESFFNTTLGRVLPEGARTWSLNVLSSARHGLQILPDHRLVGFVFLVSLLLWSLPILSSYVLILGFGFDVPAAAAFVIFVAIGVGTALPNPPGMVGVFQVACVVALGLFGVDKADAFAYGVLLNAIQLLTLVAQGAVALPLANVELGTLTREAVRQENVAG